MPKLHGRIPSYRRHRASGQAVVTLSGRDHYLGPHGSKTSIVEYDRLVAEWLATRRTLTPGGGEQGASGVTIDQLVHAFWQHAKRFCVRPDGLPTGETENYRNALRPLRRMYGGMLIGAFSPLKLKALREHFIKRGWSRGYINHQIGRVRSMIRWGVENELAPAGVLQALQAVKALSRGRSEARETEPVQPVARELVDAVQPYVSEQVWDLIQLQLLTGARAGELVSLRCSDLKIDGDIWTAEPKQHKTQHHGFSRRITLGPKAQAIVKKYLGNRPLDAYLFSPKEAESARRRNLHARRKTPLGYGNRPGSNRLRRPQVSPGAHYTLCSYRRAIAYACAKAFPLPAELARRRVPGPKGTRREPVADWKARLGDEKWKQAKAWQREHQWHPHQLRHNAATSIRKAFGLEAARAILGHRSVSTTQIYAEIDQDRVDKVIKQIG